MSKPNVIAIDGPAGSGKSTVARRVAEELKFLYIDTGAMYRALTLKAIRQGVDMHDKRALAVLSQNTDIELENTGHSLRVLLDGNDVSDAIRTMEVTKSVKLIAPIKEVRSEMVRLQRKLGLSGHGAVLEGRDIGTVVFPDARYKFYIDAGFDTRVKRRFDELKAKRLKATVEEVAEDLRARDDSDINRKIGPLKKADDALYVDTTGMSIEEVVAAVLGKVEG